MSAEGWIFALCRFAPFAKIHAKTRYDFILFAGV